MKRFELRRSAIEISCEDRFEIKEGCTTDQDYRVIQKFSTKEEALDELEDYQTEVQSIISGSRNYYNVIEFYVECDGDIWGCTKMEIKLIEKPSYETIAVFNNYEAAEKARNDYEGEAYLSFL